MIGVDTSFLIAFEVASHELNEAAWERALRWWSASETVQLFPSSNSVQLFARWMEEPALGRKQILDAMLAAVYKSSNVQLVLTSDARDFGRYPGMHPVLTA